MAKRRLFWIAGLLVLVALAGYARSDLSIASVAINPSGAPILLEPGQAVTISGSVQNNRLRGALSVKVNLFVNDALVSTQNIGRVGHFTGAGSFTFSWIPPREGFFTIRVVADQANLLGDASSGDNVAIRQIEVRYKSSPSAPPPSSASGSASAAAREAPAVPEKADLAVGRDLTVFPDPVVGKECYLCVDVVNRGGKAAREVDVMLKIGDAQRGYVTVKEIAAGGMRHVVFPWTPEVAGRPRVVVILDPDNIVPEAREANNQAFMRPRVVPVGG